jgi:hypothetical protein
MYKRDNYGLNLWQRFIVLLFLRMPPNIDRFMRRSGHYQDLLLRYYASHKTDIPFGDVTAKDVIVFMGELICSLFLVAMLYVIFLMICACTDYNWVPIH